MEDVVYKTMNTIEGAAIGDLDEDPEFSGGGDDDAIRRKSPGELYDLLINICTGDALAIIVATEDCRGYVAWQRLANKCTAKTMARAIKLVSQVTCPQKIRSIKDVEARLDKREEAVKVLEGEFKETFSPMVKIGIMTSIMPAEIQDQVYNTIEPNSSYEVITSRIRTVVGNKIAMMGGPSPMDVGNVHWQVSHDIYGDYDEAEEVGAVGAHIQCHRCSGWGHLSRECPSKGKGKL